MKLLAVAALLLATLAVGCGRSTPPKPLPKPAHWIGDRIWVPAGDARAMADVVCVYSSGPANYETFPLEGGEIIDCGLGVNEDYGR